MTKRTKINIIMRRSLKAQISYEIGRRYNRTLDIIAFGLFGLIAGRQPNDEEYFGSRTRRELLAKLR